MVTVKMQVKNSVCPDSCMNVNRSHRMNIKDNIFVSFCSYINPIFLFNLRFNNTFSDFEYKRFT